MLCGTALRTKGVQLLLDAVVDYLPSPLDIPAVKGMNPDTGEEEERPPDPTRRSPASSSRSRPIPTWVGSAMCASTPACSRPVQTLQNTNKDRKERMGRLVQVYAEKREDVTELRAGDIGAIVGVKQTFTGETLCDPSRTDRPRSHRVPRAGHLHRGRAEDQGRPGQAGERAAAPGRRRPDLPRPRRRADRPDADQRHGRAAPRRAGRPHAARVRRAGARGPAPGCLPRDHHPQGCIETRFVRQTGGRGQYAHVIVDLEPMERGKASSSSTR